MTTTSRRGTRRKLAAAWASLWLALLIALVFAPVAPGSAQEGGSGQIREGVRETARQDGRVRVIINLNVPEASGRVSLDRMATAIENAQNSVLDTLEPGRNRASEFASSRFEMLHQYSNVPALAGFLTPEGIRALENHPAIASIQVDEMGTGGLGQARNIIGADKVASSFDITGEGMKVAVVDSGVDLDHVFLQDDINPFGICYTFGDCDTAQNPNANQNTSNYPNDENGHGTAVSGIITSNSPTHTGVAPGVTIVPIRVLDRNNTGYVSDWVAGLNWIIQNQGGLGVDVISISIQTQQVYSANCDLAYPTLASAVNTLVNNLNIPVVSITGNYANPNAITAPGCVSNIITVGATYDFNGGFNETGCADNAIVDKITCFTNSGPMLDVLAPGAIVFAPQFNTGQDSPWSGTSAAAPMVAGTIAMMLQKNAALTPAQVLTLLQQSGKAVTDTRNGLTFRRITATGVLDLMDPVNTIAPVTNANIYEGDPLFQWEDRTYSSWFRVEVYNITGGFSTFSDWVQRGSFCDGNTCAKRLGLNLVDGQNRWRVQTFVDGTGPGQYSPWVNFNALGPVLSTPNTTIGTPLATFTWAKFSDATWYNLYITGSNAVYDPYNFDQWFESSAVCDTTTCTVTLDTFQGVLYDGSYKWYVRPWNDEFYGVWGGPKNFALDVAAPPAPNIGGVTNLDSRTPTFNWTVGSSISAATWFNVRVRFAAGSEVYNAWYRRPELCGDLTGTSCSVVSKVELANNANYVVDVRAFGPGGMGPYSGTSAFTTNVPTPDTPSGLNVIVSQGDPRFIWSRDDKALWYHLTVTRASDGADVLNKWYQVGNAPLSCTDFTCSVLPNLYLQNGTYNWQVEAWGKGGFSPAPAVGTPIVLNLGTPPPPAVNLMDTRNLEVHTDKSRLVYEWPDSPPENGATWYQIVIRDPDGVQLHSAWYRRLNITCVDILCEVSPPVFLKNGADYTWQVRAWGPGGMGGWSENASFTVAAASQATPPNVSTATPSGTINTNYPNFTWATRSGVTWVELAVRRTSNNTVVHQQWLDVNNLGCAGGAGTCTADQTDLDGLELNDGTYGFKIRFYGPAGISPWSSERVFSVDGPSAPAVTTINSPANGSTLTSGPVTFSWQASSNTTWYRLRLINIDTDTTKDEWFTAEALGCAGGGTCSVTRTTAPAVYNWVITGWGPGTPGASMPNSATFNFTLLN